jgi:hypothetical protein
MGVFPDGDTTTLLKVECLDPTLDEVQDNRSAAVGPTAY